VRTCEPRRAGIEAELVDVRVDAQRRIYSVRAEPLRAVEEWLAPYRRLWAERLDALAGARTSCASPLRVDAARR
jgi:hypothetical protein